MKRVFSFLVMVIFAALVSCTNNVDIESEKVQVKVVLDQLIKASEAEDMEMLSKVYAHDPDMVILGTDSSERIVGWEKLKEVMEQQFALTENSKLPVRDQVIKVHNSGKVAWFSEIIDWSLVSNEQAVVLEGLRATGVLEKREKGWVIVQLHFSIPEGNQDAEV